MQFCLLADSLPIIFCLITCLYQGERLDHRSCEALEVVLKSLHFDFINLQAAQLEENVSFMSKTYFPHLRLPIPIQFHIQAFLCIRLEAIFFFPKELHNIPCQIWGLAFFIFFLLYFFFFSREPRRCWIWFCTMNLQPILTFLTTAVWEHRVGGPSLIW